MSVRFFICGSALRGQPDHHVLAAAHFLGEVHTAPLYRMHSVDARHPAVYEASDGVSISGELYELSDEEHETLLAQEPPGLYEDEIRLSDGTTARAMLFPKEIVQERGYRDISSFGGWATFKASTASGAQFHRPVLGRGDSRGSFERATEI